MQVIDRRDTEATTTFGEIALGGAFQNEEGCICIKTGEYSILFWANTQWESYDGYLDNATVISLEATYIFERERGRK